jgi:hypothetical protein
MNFMMIIQTAQLIFGMIPVILQAMKAVEESVGPTMPGAQKLEMVRAGLEAAYNMEQGVAQPFGAIWPAIASMIGVLKASPVFTAPTAAKPIG